MQELLTFITEAATSGSNAGSMMQMFGKRLQSLYGPCAVALVSQIGLAKHQCQLTEYVDPAGNVRLSDDHLKTASDKLPVYTSENLQDFLNPAEPRFASGKEPLICGIFGDLFHQYPTIVCLPLCLPQGVYKWMLILFLSPTRLQRIDTERILLIATLATNLGIAVENTRQLQQANEWIANELNSVAKIQRQLLPQDLSATPGLNVASRFAPYAQVGGDYYDITQLPSYFPEDQNNTPQWGFMIADASGHGSAAAVEIAMFDAILRTYPSNNEAGPAGVFNYANRHLFTRTIRGNYITAFVSAYLPNLGVLSYCNAGHPPPMLKRQKNPRNISFLDEATGIPLGITPDGQWQSASTEMHKGDIIILYTDGLTEAVSESGEAFGYERLEAIVAESDNNPQLILENIEAALSAHQKQLRQKDDQTLLIIQAAS
jgi:serine phosphatase RsbU (regulator of sigma subunit)